MRYLNRGHKFIVQIIDVFVTIVLGFLVFRFVLKLFGASSSSGFVDWMYRTTKPLIAPFKGAFPSPVIERGLVFEFNTLLAIVVYALLGWLLVSLVDLVARSTTSEG